MTVGCAASAGMSRVRGATPAVPRTVCSGQGVKGQQPPRHPFVAGAVAGGIEAVITYPFEYTKAQLQLGTAPYRTIRGCFAHTVREFGWRGMYRGMSPWLVFAFPKTAVRFTTFETAKETVGDWTAARVAAAARPVAGGAVGVAVLQGAQPPPVGPLGTLLCGMAAGLVECLVVGVVMNTVSVKMVDDRNRPHGQPAQFRGLRGAMSSIVRSEGLGGLYCGVAPLMVKMVANQAIRFSVYGAISRWATQGRASGRLSMAESAGAGAVAGMVSVFVTQPVDMVRTRMMGLQARQYSGSVDCAVQVYRQGGLSKFYVGTLPRLVRVALEVAVVFALFEKVSQVLDEVW